jgi:hypothetical protein
MCAIEQGNSNTEKDQNVNEPSARYCYMNDRTANLMEMGDPLVALKKQIHGEAFRFVLEVVYYKPRKSNSGVKPIDGVLMFKILVLWLLNNLLEPPKENWYEALEEARLSKPISGKDI